MTLLFRSYFSRHSWINRDRIATLRQRSYFSRHSCKNYDREGGRR